PPCGGGGDFSLSMLPRRLRERDCERLKYYRSSWIPSNVRLWSCDLVLLALRCSCSGSARARARVTRRAGPASNVLGFGKRVVEPRIHTHELRFRMQARHHRVDLFFLALVRIHEDQ